MTHAIGRLLDWILGRSRREVARAEAFRLISASLAMDVSPTMSLSLLAEEHSGLERRELHRMASDLSMGQPLSVAMRRAPNVFPDWTNRQIEAIENTAALEPFLKEWIERYDLNVATDQRARYSRSWPQRLGTWVPCLLLLTFVMLFIVPTFRQMFDEFGLVLPPPTLLLISVSRWFAAYWFLLVLGLFVMASLFSRLGRGERFDRWIWSWLLPSRRRTIRASRLRIMASLAKVGLPPETALVGAVDRKGLADSDWREPQQAGWVTPREQDLLLSLQTDEEIAWALDRMADYLDFRNRRKIAVGHQTSRMLGTLLFGLIVGFFCISLYLPLVSLISGLS